MLGDNDTTVEVSEIPSCDFEHLGGTTTQAAYDGKTNMGPWAYMCETHFKMIGVGLGLGKGQRLVLKK